MYDDNVKQFIEPLIDVNWNKKDRNILDGLRITLKDSLYFRCFKKLFPSYIEYIFMCLMTSFKFKKYKPHETILNYNDKINSMYFIVKGKLNVYRMSSSKIKNLLTTLLRNNRNINKWKEILDYFNDFVKRYIRAVNHKNIYSIFKKEIKIPTNIDIKINTIDELEYFFKKIISFNKTFCYSLEEGKIFGEEYIYNDINYSNCILESESELILAELSKKDYEKIYKKINIIEKSSITGFLANLKIFNSSNFFLPKLQRCLIKRNYAKNEIIFNQNDNFRTFFLIRKGKVNLSLKIPKKVNCILESDIIIGNKKNQRFTSNDAYVIRGKYLENTDYNFITIQNGEFIGDIEYYKKNEKYLYTAQCIEDDAIIFEFDLFLFENIIINNVSINMNLKGFYEKIKEKINLYQDRIYNMKKNSSPIKKSDYILSKNKFTSNLLQNHPLKEFKENKNIIYPLNSKTKKRNKSDYFYFEVVSPFLNRNISQNRNKKLKKIQINDAFFNSQNTSKEEVILTSNSTSRSFHKSKERSNTASNIKNLSQSKLMMYNQLSNNIFSKLYLSKDNIFKNFENNKNNFISDCKKTTNTRKNFIFNEFMNYNSNGNNPVKTNILYNNSKNKILSKKNKNLYKSTNNLTNSNNIDKTFDFMDSNLFLSGNEKIKNIPIILKETKNINKYKDLYDKNKINKIKTFYFNPAYNRSNKIFKK